MTLAQRITGFVELWRLALPHIQPPSVQDTARWGSYDPAIVERAILRTARRFAADRINSAFQAEEANRYVSAVTKGESKEHGS